MMNNANEISHQTMLYGYIGEEAGQSSLSAKTNKLFKQNNKDAMMIPMNIREDDFYFTVANMKKSHVNGAVISNEYVGSVVEILDDASEAVKRSGMCDILLRDGQRLVGDIFSTRVLIDFLKEKCVKNIALIGTTPRAKAFCILAEDFAVSHFSDDLEELMKFTLEMQIAEPDINRIAYGMDIDMSKYDATIDFSDLESLKMVNRFSDINLDMKHKKEFSLLKARVNELGAAYIGFDDMLDKLSDGVFEYLKSKKHLDYDKSDMRF